MIPVLFLCLTLNVCSSKTEIYLIYLFIHYTIAQLRDDWDEVLIGISINLSLGFWENDSGR